MTLRILLVDDHEIVRVGLRSLLERHPDFVVVDEAGTAREALEKALIHRPDVVVMDIRLPGGDGISACREIKQQLPKTNVIMLTSYAEDEMLFEAIDAGAAGYVLRQIGGDELIRAIERIGRGEALLDPQVTQQVLRRLREASWQERAAAFADLTEQELRVLSLVAEGRTNREIARMLYLGEGTVRNYVSNILSKLNLTNRAEAAAYAVKHNLKDLLEQM